VNEGRRDGPVAAEFRLAEERFRTAVEGMPDGFGLLTAIRDGDGAIADFRLEWANAAARELIGVPAAALGRPLRELWPGFPGSDAFASYRRVVETDRPSSRESVPVVRIDGRAGDRVVDVRASPLGDGVVVIWRDVTELRRTYEALDAAHADLARVHAQLRAAHEHLGRLYDELTREAAQLEHSNASLREFAHIVSHDLIEPLTTVSRFGEALEQRLAGNLDASSRAMLHGILRATAHGQELVHDVLAFAEMSRGTVRRRPVDTHALVGDVLATLRGAIERSGAHVTVDGELPALEADPALLRQVFQNLLSNATKFAAPGRPPRIRVAAERAASGAWRFSVEDDGIGVPPGEEERIFDAFHRARSSGDTPGTGLGLAITRRAVELHGGRISVRPSPASGSRFEFTLPDGR